MAYNVVPTEADVIAYSDMALSLPYYSQLVGVHECTFFGVQLPVNFNTRMCKEIIRKNERDQVARYLLNAQAKMEEELRYFLCPKWVTSSPGDFYRDEQRFERTGKLVTDWTRLLAAGIRAETVIVSGATIVYGDLATLEDATVTVATTLTDESEIYVYHPGTDIEITPSSITLNGVNLILKIPRYRMVLPSMQDNDGNGLVYADNVNFETTVDVKRVYTDNSTNATIRWPCGCGETCTGECDGKTQTACMYIKNYEMGAAQLKPANYTGGAWVNKSLCFSYDPGITVQMNYKAGLTTLPESLRSSLLRLAHVLMPYAPCAACSPVGEIWNTDRKVPLVLTRERLNCPWGLSDGAWQAWTAVRNLSYQTAPAALAG